MCQCPRQHLVVTRDVELGISGYGSFLAVECEVLPFSSIHGWIVMDMISNDIYIYMCVYYEICARLSFIYIYVYIYILSFMG